MGRSVLGQRVTLRSSQLIAVLQHGDGHHDAVPMATARLNELLRASTVAQGLTHDSHGTLKRCVADELVRPHLLTEFLLGDDPVMMGEQIAEHLKDFGAQRGRATGAT